MFENTRKIAAPLMALLMLLSVAAGGAVAVEGWDTETTDTVPTSDAAGATTTLTWNVSSSGQFVYVAIDGATNKTNYTAQYRSPHTNKVLFQNKSAKTEAVTGTGSYYSWNDSHADLAANLPRAHDGGTYNLTIKNESSGNVVLSTELILDAANSSDSAQIYVSDAAATVDSDGSPLEADVLTLEDEEMGLIGSLAFWSNASEVATVRDNAAVDSNATLTYHMLNTSTAEAYDAAAEDVADSGTMWSAQTIVNDELAKTYKGSAPDAAGSDGQPYAVYDERTDELTIYPGDTTTDRKTADVKAVAGESFGFWEAANAFGYADALDMDTSGFQSALGM